MKAEFTEGVEIAATDRVSGRLRKKRRGSHLYLGPGVFIEDSGLVYVSPQASGLCCWVGNCVILRCTSFHRNFLKVGS